MMGRLEMLKSNTLWKEPCGNEFYTVDKTDYDWIISTIEEQHKEIAKTETYFLDISGRMDDLHEYLRENHYGKGLGKHIVDVAIQVMEEQQKEIEGLQKLVNYHQEKQKEAEDENEPYRHENARLQKEIEFLNKAHQTNIKIAEYAQQENKRYREALEFYAEQDNYRWEISYRPQQEIDCMVIDDGGHTARKALGVSQN